MAFLFDIPSDIPAFILAFTLRKYCGFDILCGLLSGILSELLASQLNPADIFSGSGILSGISSVIPTGWLGELRPVACNPTL